MRCSSAKPPNQPPNTSMASQLKRVRDSGRAFRLEGMWSVGHTLKQSAWLQARNKPYTTAGRTKMRRAGPWGPKNSYSSW
eukprot:1152346-Pelagomonas_calceolata.AAC.10